MSAAKTWVITGSTSGVGAAVGSTLADAGHNVVLAGRRADKGEALAAAINSRHPGRAVFVKADVTQEADLAAIFAAAEKHFGGFDVLFNNAGITGPAEPLANVTTDTFDKVFHTNVLAVQHGIRLAIPKLAARGGGVIINTSSGAAMMPFPKFSTYAASKSAVDAITRTAAAELGEQNIKVYSANLFLFDSDMAVFAAEAFIGERDPHKMAAGLNPSGKLGKGEELAVFLEELVAGKHDAAFPSGSTIAIDAGNSVFLMEEMGARMAKAKEAKGE